MAGSATENGHVDPGVQEKAMKRGPESEGTEGEPGAKRIQTLPPGESGHEANGASGMKVDA